MSKTIRELDEDKVKDYKEDIDTLLVFVRHRISCSVPYLDSARSNRLVYSPRSSRHSSLCRIRCFHPTPKKPPTNIFLKYRLKHIAILSQLVL